MNNNEKQQIALLPMNYSKIITSGIIISDSSDVDKETCSDIENAFYYVLTILVTESDETQAPIARMYVNSISKFSKKQSKCIISSV